MAKVGSVCFVRLPGGGDWCLCLVDEAVSCLSAFTSGGVFGGVCDLIMILGSLSANRWDCVPVLLVVWHTVSST